MSYTKKGDRFMEEIKEKRDEELKDEANEQPAFFSQEGGHRHGLRDPGHPELQQERHPGEVGLGRWVWRIRTSSGTTDFMKSKK